MVSKEYSEAAVEVLDILNHVDSENVKKIPTKFIDFLEKNKSKEYECNLDHSKKIKEMELKPKTEAILGFIYLKYWADEEGKKKFEQKLRENEQFFENELKQGFDKAIFKQSNMDTPKETINENLLAECKKVSFISSLMEKIKNIFRRI